MSELHNWVAKIRHIHDEYFSYPWDEHLGQLNERLGLTGDARLMTPAPGLPPVWINGNIEELKPHRWVLVISLNPGVGGKTEDAPPVIAEQHSTPDERWNYWLTFIIDHWFVPFFRPLVRVASGALGEKVDVSEEPGFATVRMLFVELCPYASHKFGLSWKQVKELTDSDLGFQVAHKVRQIALREGRPALILINGNQAIYAVDGDINLKMPWSERRYESVSKHGKWLHHWESAYDTEHGTIPIARFPFLNKPNSFGSNQEYSQLADHLRLLVVRTGQSFNDS